MHFSIVFSFYRYYESKKENSELKKKYSNYEKVFSEKLFNYEENEHFIERISFLEKDLEDNQKIIEDLAEKQRDLRQKNDFLENESKRIMKESAEETVKF